MNKISYFDCLSLISGMLSTSLQVDAKCLIPDTGQMEKLDQGILKLIYEDFQYSAFIMHPVFNNPEENTIYFVRTALERNYVLFKLPEQQETQPEILLFVIGPCLFEEPSSAFYERILTNNRISGSSAGVLKTYLATVPVVNEMILLTTVHTIAPYIFKDYKRGQTQYVDLDLRMDFSEEPSAMLNFSMELLEKRYRIENALLNAVSQGRLSDALDNLQAFGKIRLPSRLFDPVRDLKNILIILNTLYRKAAEKGHVHPVYLDETSTRFSIEIEHIHNLDELQMLPVRMTRKYCHLVNNYSLSSYSHTIRKVINYINLNLSSPLALKILADNLKLNSSYLSAQFKKETGVTLTEYIHSTRIQAAVQLLNATALPIREVAYRVGLEDFSYFTKLFRKYIHMSPIQYRNMLHKKEHEDALPT